MDKKVLAIYWLNGRFKALSIYKGEVKAVWESPKLVEDESNFQAALTDSVSQTGYDGVKVSVLISNRKTMFHLIEVPPVTGADLEYYVERKANQLKTFDDPLAFCYKKTLPTRISNGLLINIYPRPFLEKLAEACRNIDLHLSRMFTLQSVMQMQLGSLKVPSEEVVALAADVEGATALLIGRKDGEIYFGRTIYGDWKVDAEYVGTEIMRSILFVKQQFGAMALRLFIYGNENEKWTKTLEQFVGFPVEAPSYPSTPVDWLKESLKIRDDVTDNLVTPDLRQEPQARLFLKMVGFLAVVVAVCIGGWIGFVEKNVAKQNSEYMRLIPLLEKLEGEKKVVISRKEELEHRQQFVKYVTDNITNPVPGWFFGYLCDVFPDDLVLKELHIHQTNGLWYVHIDGVVQPADNKNLEQALSFGLQLLQNRLERSPFHFKVTGKTKFDLSAAISPISNSSQNDFSSALAMRREAGISMLGDGLTNTPSSGPLSFVEKIKGKEKTVFWLEGVMQ